MTACSDLGTEPGPTATDLTVAGADRGAAKMAPAPGDQSIAEIAIEAEFEELVGALQYVDAELDAELVDLFLNGTDPYTVFAPTDAAFEDLYALLGDVLDAEIDEVEDLPAPVVLDVLLYHVTEGRRASNSVVPPRMDRDHRGWPHGPPPGRGHRERRYLGQQRHHPRHRPGDRAAVGRGAAHFLTRRRSAPLWAKGRALKEPGPFAFVEGSTIR